MRPLVEWGHPEISVRRQCELLGVNRSGLYYEPVGESEELHELVGDAHQGAAEPPGQPGMDVGG